MLTSKQQEQKSKQRKIRNSEYYDMVSTFDGMYANSKKGKIFNHLMEIIESEENIKLAYRTIKTNSWNNFGRVMEKIDFGQALKNSLFFVVFGVAGLLVICSMAAYRLARHRTRVNKFVYLLLVSSILVPFQTVMIPLIKIIASIGLYNTRIGVLLAYYGYGIPFAVFLFYGFLSSIPREIEEAALIDGGSLFQVYRCIILPLLKPICVTVAVLDVLWIYNDFLLPFVLISDNELRTLPLVMYTFFTAYERPWDLAMASLTMVLTPAIIMFVILQKQITGGIVSGAVKG